MCLVMKYFGEYFITMPSNAEPRFFFKYEVRATRSKKTFTGEFFLASSHFCASGQEDISKLSKLVLLMAKKLIISTKLS